MKSVNKTKIKARCIFMLLFLNLIVAIPVLAQSPILPLTTGDIGIHIPDNAYLKDVNNELNKFVGTWEYSEAGVKLTVEIQKIEMYTNSHIPYFKDILVGRYKYEINGTTVIDNLGVIEPFIYGSKIDPTNSNILSFVGVVDPQRKRVNYNLGLTHEIDLRSISPDTIETLVWDLKTTEIGWCGSLPDQPAPAPSDCLKDNRLPLHATLTRI